MGNTVTTPALTAVATSTVAAHGHSSASAKQSDNGPSFESVLNNRPNTQAPASTSDKSKQGQHVAMSTGKDRDRSKETTKDTANDSAAPDQPQTLPQIALYIAAQANGTLSVQGKLDDTSATAKSTDAIKGAIVDPAGKANSTEHDSTLAGANLPTVKQSDFDTTLAQAGGTAALATARESAAAAAAAATTAAAKTTISVAPDTAHAGLAPTHQNSKHGPTAHVAMSAQDIAKAGRQPTTSSTASNSSTTGPSAGSTDQPHVHPDLVAATTSNTVLRGKQQDDTQDKPGASVLSATQAAFTPMSSAATSLGAPMQPGIAAPLQSPQWSGQFAQQFVSLTHSVQPSGSHHAQLRLDPPNLGPLHVSININDNIAHAVFTSPHAAVRQAVENALPQLQQQLAQSGISLGQTSVNDQGAQHDSSAGGSFSHARGTTRAVGGIGSTSDSGTTVTMPVPKTRVALPDAIVDTFA